MLGGGVSDSYQPVEKKLRIAERCLEIVLKWRKPVHILTKSTLVERDVALLKKIQHASAALVSVSFSTVNDQIARTFEPGCPPPSRRLEMMARLIGNGLPVGMFLLPVIPGISDSRSEVEQSVAAAANIGASFVVFGGMTLKPGRQTSHFYDVLRTSQPDILPRYPLIYKGNAYGAAVPKYYQRIEQRFTESARKHKIHRRIPPQIFSKICGETDRLRIILAHLDYLQGACGGALPFGRLKKSLRDAGDTPELFAYSSLPMKHRVMIQDILSDHGQKWYEKYL